MSKAIPKYTGEGFFKRNAAFFTDSLNFTTRNLKDVGDFYYSNMMMRPYYITSNPEAINHVLVNNQKNYIKSPAYQQLKMVIGNGLVTSEGDFWRKQRRLAQPAFYKKNLVELYKVMQEGVKSFQNELVQDIQKNDTIDLSEQMSKITADIVCRTLFTTNDAGDDKMIYQAISASQEFVVFCMQNPHLVPFSYINGKRRNFYKNKAILDKKIFSLIEERRQTKAETPDLLNMLMNIQDADTGEVMSNQQLRDEVMTMYIAGQETSANALSWTLYLLAKHPEVMERLRAEVQFVLGNNPTPSFHELMRLQYTKQVLDESMRLYPPVWSLGRQSLEKDTILGYEIPKGAIVFISNYTLQRDPRYWKNPDAFNPDRFHPDNQSPQLRLHYLPFGAGPRMCIGKHFAMMEMQLILSVLVNNFNFELIPDQEIIPQALVTLKPKHGIKMRLKSLVPNAGSTKSKTNLAGVTTSDKER